MGNPFWRTCATGLKPRDMARGWCATWSVDIYAVVRPSTCCPSLLRSWMQASDMSQRMARTSRFLPVGILALERRLTVDCRRHLAAIPRTATLPRVMHWWSSSIARCPLTERHHPYHTRFHVGALGVGKSNHDINVILKAPLEASFRIATYYITAYISKVQPHLASLWHRLEAGQRKLEAEELVSNLAPQLQNFYPFLQDLKIGKVDLAMQGQPLSPHYVASRTLTRMQMSAQKRSHKSFPEICHYLLGFPEAYVNHSFRRLYYTNLLRKAALRGFCVLCFSPHNFGRWSTLDPHKCSTGLN